MTKKIEVFIQGEGLKDIIMVKVSGDGSVGDLIEAAKEHGLIFDENEKEIVFIEEEKDVLHADVLLNEAKINNHCHVHIHRCRKLYVSVNFNGQQESRKFPPSATIGRVKKWATKAFGMSKTDATEHALQIVESDERPAEDIHIGTLVVFPNDQLSFDLVPKVRVEG